METIEILKHAQLLNDLSSLANQASYGLVIVERGDFGAQAIDLLEKGIIFFEKINQICEQGEKSKAYFCQIGDNANVPTVLSDAGILDYEAFHREANECLEKLKEIIEDVRSQKTPNEDTSRELDEILNWMTVPFYKEATSLLESLRERSYSSV